MEHWNWESIFFIPSMLMASSVMKNYCDKRLKTLVKKRSSPLILFL